MASHKGAYPLPQMIVLVIVFVLISQKIGFEMKFPFYSMTFNVLELEYDNMLKHRKDCETALWAEKGFIESQPFIERKALLKERLY